MPEAGPERRIDEALMGGDFANRAKIDMKDEAYLKQLVHLASGGKWVAASGRRQVGGGEGFLAPYDRGKDACRDISANGATTGSPDGVVMIFDNNDLLATVGP